MQVASLAGAVVLIVIFLVSSVGLDSGSGPPASDQQVCASCSTFLLVPCAGSQRSILAQYYSQQF